MKSFENFNAMMVPLEGSNLIEASAGTGKTYSIAILVLRLILDKKLSIKEILMVTFTKAAVAELEERIRLFIREAYKVSQGDEIGDTTISELVDQAIETYDKETVQSSLKEAILFLDETSVLTIHRFCQLTLNEFAFETRQLFGAELLQDTNAVLEKEINKFWRKNITAINPVLLLRLVDAGISRSSISAVVNQHLSGKRYLEYNATESYDFCDQTHVDLINSVAVLADKEARLKFQLEQYVVDNKDRLNSIKANDRYAKKNNDLNFDNAKQVLKYIGKHKIKPAYIGELFIDIIEKHDEWEVAFNELDILVKRLISRIYCLAIKEVTAGIKGYKHIHNKISFDDLIVNLQDAVVKRENPGLIDCLQNKYKAVFIDEFQDTDRLQYEIFHKVFGNNTILFYIGDPKQSIYAWRKADIFTYFKAKEAVGHLYSMNNNFRSSEAFINAMNVFFKPEDDFDTFYFANDGHSIDYTLVNSPSFNSKGNLFKGKEIDVPITLTMLSNKESINDAVAAQVLDLLTNEEYLLIKNEVRRIKPSDIGVLVRSKFEGKAIKARLGRIGVPAVTIGDDKVLNSDEAKDLLYVLEAMTNTSGPAISKALLTSFTGFDDSIILSLDYDHTVELFRKYKTSWEKDGIYKVLHDFISDYDVKEALLNHNSEYGERIITNLYQLIELLHKVQTNKKLSPSELISWLKRGIEGMETEGDEFEQRIESDEDAVKIVTIHSSKGLEYNIVLAPFLDMQIKDRDNCSYRDPETCEYVSAEKPQLTQVQVEEYYKQLEQENRRLIYVAITRAVYRCFIYKNTSSKSNNSSLLPFTDALQSKRSPLFEFKDNYPDLPGVTYKVQKRVEVNNNRCPIHFSLLEKNWCRMSYSRLRADHEIGIKNKSTIHKDLYDHFIFSQLTKGAKTGNMLHSIFENIHFADKSKWQFAIDNALGLFAPTQSESYQPMLMAMLEHVLNVTINIGNNPFNLSDLSASKCIHEFEFDFPVPSFRVQELRDLSDERITIDVKDMQEVEGVMNGKIDLFFECNGKYYVLDWKSNYLGDSLDDYSPHKLDEAMDENNYHLQYLLYTVAVKKYLESRLNNFSYEDNFGGVIYLFVRGIRTESDKGIFAYKPTIEKIEALQDILSGRKEREVIVSH